MIQILKYVCSMLLIPLSFVTTEAWATDSTRVTPLPVNVTAMPPEGTVLVSGMLGPLRCGYAKANSTSYNNYDAACNNGIQVSYSVCPSPLTHSVSVALVRYDTCASAKDKMYGIKLDPPTIGTKNGGYYLYWKKSDSKQLFAGYNTCDDRSVVVSYIVYCR